jgi:hypothetical protein
MANFFCVCRDCENKLTNQLRQQHRISPSKDEYEELVLFETGHGINASAAEIADALICPRCQGSNCIETFYGYNIVGYVRGDGYLDRAGCHRDMNLYHLSDNDPYKDYRQPGEVDELKSQLKRAGQHQPRRVYDSGDMARAVVEATAQSAVDS